MRTINRRQWFGVVLGLAASLLAGCEPVDSRPDPGPTRLVTPRQGPVPNPNPDTGPGGARTPGPVAGDPNPHDERRYVLMVAFSPAREFVKIDWEVGPDNDRIRERGRGQWSKEGKTWKGNMVKVSADWTDISYANLGKQNITGSIMVSIDIDGAQVCRQETPPFGRPRGALCAARA